MIKNKRYKQRINHIFKFGLKHSLLFTVGIVISIVSFGTLFLIEYSELNYQLNTNLTLRVFLKSTLYCFGIALIEEILFRYLFLYKWLLNPKETFNSKVLYLGIISSVIFGFLHFELTLFPKLQILIALSGISLFYGVYKLRSIGIAIGMHFSWNMIEGVILPFQGSGSSIESLFLLDSQMKIWPENSNYMIISILIEILLIYVLSTVYTSKIIKTTHSRVS